MATLWQLIYRSAKRLLGSLLDYGRIGARCLYTAAGRRQRTQVGWGNDAQRLGKRITGTNLDVMRLGRGHNTPDYTILRVAADNTLAEAGQQCKRLGSTAVNYLQRIRIQHDQLLLRRLRVP